ncbi:MAG: hypothetical protein A2268_13175 [Candidatus Raymondbacteria bacterium RifOxyA12_full_50_37]|uniref:Uncharacterized protein n=1 Tax=Candidatus Raymondbacteria bacterium RIFOXYD12_FULL_49_13 TaxID=1817890 RepID=A0A1F7F052_UNCRA|nr:MAG: hypothetical protein A2268_13175 [Candidatus Raymondbacteria bacterium RifOxyA12_full_50_37]OGJ93013.1 MAG: hypothetical protein A2248_18310 [Candidatus Raymondbacteria bacterium RIFOXYA2_FULL_49_16]OGJ93595.1 MAG: hypothetical protein A2350_19115 [Candidatus Raymondbacteria bacterium RifOxyB12_full_50_8]OGJ99926.1 MAG: hypothetical protein A2519_00290 [Candidatus Raymondbacteria bacterium RIFOXYD12_FULL_49_13]OGK01564.1 MAG: hypothetical protein A2487_15590 [Candidatus Raymondbacteria 
MQSWVDGSLYPDESPPLTFTGLPEKVDFLARVCGAWDFGILPRSDTIQEILQPEWKAAVDACNLLTSASYHLVRKWHGLKQLPYLGDQLAYIRDDENLQHI